MDAEAFRVSSSAIDLIGKVGQLIYRQTKYGTVVRMSREATIISR